jgi:hypothetical protein
VRSIERVGAQEEVGEIRSYIDVSTLWSSVRQIETATGQDHTPATAPPGREWQAGPRSPRPPDSPPRACASDRKKTD